MVTGIGAKKKQQPKHNMIKQNNGTLKTVLIKYSFLESIGNFIPITASKAVALNAAGEAAKTV